MSTTIKRAPQIAVTVIYNGIPKNFEAQSRAAVQSLLSRAVAEFGVQQQPHVLSLFTEANVELADQSSFESNGIETGAKLLLRPSAVKGGDS